MFPEIVDPDFAVRLETMTAISVGTVAGGPELLPGSDDHVWPHEGVWLVFSKPLKLAGPGPPVIGLDFAHCAPHQRTEPKGTFVRSPITKAPPDPYWYSADAAAAAARFWPSPPTISMTNAASSPATSTRASTNLRGERSSRLNICHSPQPARRRPTQPG